MHIRVPSISYAESLFPILPYQRKHSIVYWFQFEIIVSISATLSKILASIAAI